MATSGGPLGILLGMTFDPVRNRYFPTREDEAPPRPAPSSSSLRAGFKERLKRGRGGGGGGMGRMTSEQGSSGDKPLKEERGAIKGKKPRTKASTEKLDTAESPSCLDRNTRRIDRTLLRATGLELGRMGSIHAVKMEYKLPDWDFDMDVRPTGGKSMPRMRRWLWQEINLGKRITGIRVTNEHYIATTFGPRPRIVVSQIPAMLSAFEGTPSAQPSFFQEEEKPTVLWELTKVQDAWSMDSVGNAVIVGGNHQIVYAQNIVDPVFRSIRTPGDSDALSVCQININEAIVGLRSSAILHYDFRLPDTSAVTTRLDLGKSVCGLKYLDRDGGSGRNLIASGYTNQLALFDLRFAKTGPVQRYHEHVNDYRSGLGLAVDPSGTHVFAAGSDHKIRAWSILNGQPVPDMARLLDTQGQRRLLSDSYPSLINGIEITEDNRIHMLNDRQLETYMQY
ncbi:hypothetical protein QFC21_004165 [Naganishia friedmannii]|uniref:Uncharacterized protein n=1 Tax=Naganishia friedmannii TaxID=89922 RepID=A0ACC2VJW3_9TREE|nr:hypothetical protein QFC21_004165 [Naganishia friedmannii]